MKSALLVILLFSSYMFISTAQGRLYNARSDFFAKLIVLFLDFFVPIPWVSYVLVLEEWEIHNLYAYA